MTKATRHFGEQIVGYEVPVLNEREIRASAGILFFLALIAFMNSWLVGDFNLIRLFVAAFLTDFTIRVLFGPRFSPSMILGRLAVRKQSPEWAGAPQKRFAWSVGWSLAAVMFYLIVVKNVVGPLNLLICLTCLTLMFFESAFGICLACKVFQAFKGQPAKHCPGDSCEPIQPHPSQKIGFGETIVLLSFIAVVVATGANGLFKDESRGVEQHRPQVISPAQDSCTPPDWAVKIGHAEKWKLHNNCK